MICVDGSQGVYMEMIGKKIQNLRKTKNMTQAQLAQVLSVSAQSVSKWEKNISSPDISLLPIIARYFGITMDELFNYRIDALNYKERFIRFMADNGVLQFGEFRLQSNRISPYFINTGNYKSASQIAKLGQFYAQCMRENNVESNLLVGNTHEEIPVMIATSLELYNKYGIDIGYRINEFVGKPIENADKIVLIKDTLTTGNTLKANLSQIQSRYGSIISHVIISVDRMEKGNSSFISAVEEIEKMYHVKVSSIVNTEDIIRALEKGVIGGIEYLDSLKQYQKEYGINSYCT